MSRLIDFHCHLDLYDNFESIVISTERAKVFTLGVTTTPRAWPRNVLITEKCKYIRPALGLHPQTISKATIDQELNLFERYFKEAKYIGEVGLDGRLSNIEDQERVFRRIANLCGIAGGKYLSVHTVRSAKRALDIMEREEVFRNCGVILHWFTGTSNETVRAIDLGCYFSINIAMTKSEKGRALIEKIPIDRLLTETDGPFVGNSVGALQVPSDVSNCLQKIADIKNMSVEVVEQSMLRNLQSLLNENKHRV